MTISGRQLAVLVSIFVVIFVLASLTSCESPPPTTETTTTTTTTVKPAGDATASLQSVLDSTKSLYVDTTYTVDGTLRPPAGSNITFGPAGKFVRTSASSGSAIVVSTPNVTLSSIRVVGPDPCFWTYEIPQPGRQGEKYSQYDPKRENQHVLAVAPGATNLKVSGLRAENVWGDGLYIGGGNGVTVTDLVVRCAGRSGISNVNSSNVTVTGGNISGVFWWNLNIEPWGSNSVSNYKVSQVTLGFARDSWLFVGGPDFNCLVTGVDVRGNPRTAATAPESWVEPCVANNVRTK